MNTQHTTSHRVGILWLGALVLLLAASLRIYHITLQSLWFDEAFAWNIVIQPDMFPRISTDTHPPLYYLFLRGWMAFTGDSALALRYLSALMSLLTVAFTIQVGREFARERPGWTHLPVFAGLMIALSDAEIFLAQETRNYAPYTMFASLSVGLYLRWTRTQSAKTGFAWAMATSALAYTHYQGLFIPMVQGWHVLLFLRGRQRGNGLLWLAVSSLPILPWYLLVTIPQARNAIDNSLPFAIPSNWDTFLHLRDNYLGAEWSLMAVLALFGLWGLARGKSRRAGGDAFLLALWLMLPFGVLFFGNFFAALLTERKLLIIAPAIALMVGAGITRLGAPARWLVALALIAYGVSTVDYWRVKEPWDEIAAPALELGQSGDLYLAQVEVGQYPMKYYWQRGMPDGAIFSTFPFLGDPTMSPTTDHPTYYDGLLPLTLFPYNQAEKTGAVATAWVVFWSKDDALLHALSAAGYIRTMTIPFDHLGNEIDLYRYDLLPQTALAEYRNGMILSAVEIDADALRVDLWWTASESVGREYVTSAGLLDAEGRLVAQMDSPPPIPTAAWNTDTTLYEPKHLRLVDGIHALPSGTYTVIVKVYGFTPDGGIADVSTLDGETILTVGTLTVP